MSILEKNVPINENRPWCDGQDLVEGLHGRLKEPFWVKCKAAY